MPPLANVSIQITFDGEAVEAIRGIHKRLDSIDGVIENAIGHAIKRHESDLHTPFPTFEEAIKSAALTLGRHMGITDDSQIMAAYSRYDRDRRSHGPDGYEAFRDAVAPLTEGEWGVYPETCRTCGKELAIVATVHSVEQGYTEAFEDGQLVCTTCNNQPEVS